MKTSDKKNLMLNVSPLFHNLTVNSVGATLDPCNKLEAIMKLRNLILPFVLLVLFGASACQAAECPVEVQAIPMLGIKITSVTDIVTIQSIQVNRGNVKIVPSLFERLAASNQKREPNLELPATLKFGESKTYETSSSSIREVEVQTNLGNWKFTFK